LSREINADVVAGLCGRVIRHSQITFR
jgi:hypothetical protein